MKPIRLSLVALALTYVTGWSQSVSDKLRSVDFKNFTYPCDYPDKWPDHLQWMSLRLKKYIHLVDGKFDERNATDRADKAQFAGVTLEGVHFAKLSGGNEENAIVVLRYDSGGTQYHYWVYIYGNPAGKVKLLGFFHAGDRAQFGLYQVFDKDRLLNVRLFDPKFQQGDCCSSGYLNYQFRWNGRGFEPIGNPVAGHPDSASRRPVSVFGLPVDQP